MNNIFKIGSNVIFQKFFFFYLFLLVYFIYLFLSNQGDHFILTSLLLIKLSNKSREDEMIKTLNS